MGFLLKLLIRALGLGRRRNAPPPRPRVEVPLNEPVANHPAPHIESAAKRPAREEAEVLQLLDSLPTAKVVYVEDGDTVVVAFERRQITIRLDSIDCPEDDQPWGRTARAGLIKLIGGKIVALEEHGCDDYGRTLATLYVRVKYNTEWMNVNERMLLLGHAWVMNKYFDHLPKSRQAKLFRLQRWAKSKKVGLWGTEDPVPPWKWRSAKRVMDLPGGVSSFWR